MTTKRMRNVIRSTLLDGSLSDKARWDVERLGEPAFDFIAGIVRDGGLTELLPQRHTEGGGTSCAWCHLRRRTQKAGR